MADLDLAVPAGSVFGFLGPNGSGKTTTIRMLLGLAGPSAGVARLFGETMPGAGRRVLPRVGALVEGPACYPFLSGRDNLRRLDAADRTRDARREARIETALERVGLTAAGGKRYRAYSLGMRQRLGLAAALLRPRELLVLDEPTNGLDPQGTREVRALIRSLAADGTTVFLSSHLLAEVEQVCTHAAVMRVGRLVTQGSIGAMRAAARPRLRVVTPDPGTAADVLTRCGLVATSTAAEQASDGEAIVSGELTGQAPEEVCAALVGAGARVRSFGVEQASLEDAFVALTGEGFDVVE